MEKLQLGKRMKVIKINKPNKVWVLCACPECNNEFIVELVQTDKTNLDNLFGLKPSPEQLTCPYCGIKNISYAEHFPKVEL